jgi:putative hemolysin
MTQSGWILLSLFGLVLGSVGGLGTELLDRFTGRSLEAFCRLKHRRERFGAILDGNEVALTASAYLRLIGTVLFLLGGTAAIFTDQTPPTLWRVVTWGISASGLMMLTHMWLPAAVTRHASAPVLFYSWPFWQALSFMMAPLATPGKLLAAITSRLAGNEPYEFEEEEQLEDDIRTMVTAGTREGYFGPGVRDMIQGVMDLHEDTVAHIMTPRGDIIAVEASADWPSILEIASRYGRTRLPVYEETLDKIIGVLYIKDLMPYLCNGGLSTASLAELMRPAWTVTIDQNVELLLREFLHSRSHLAIVLDEFGQTAGVVTIEDVLEEIVGEIVDESDVEEESSIVVLNDVTAKADGRAMIDDLNEQLGWDLPESDDYQTVAGYILHHTGSIPEDGQRITIGDVAFEIVRATNRQIESVQLHRLIGNEREPKTI